jgi:hypothetical protein
MITMDKIGHPWESKRDQGYMIMGTRLKKAPSTFKEKLMGEETIDLAPTLISKKGLAPLNPIWLDLSTEHSWEVTVLVSYQTELMAAAMI